MASSSSSGPISARIKNCCSWPSIRRTRPAASWRCRMSKADYLDLRLAKGLDPKLHFTQQKRISILQAGGTLVSRISPARSSRPTTACPRVFSLYATLNGDAEAGRVRLHPRLGRRSSSTKSGPSISNTPATSCISSSTRRIPSSSRRRSGRIWRTRRKSSSSIIGCLEDDLSDYLKPWNFEQLNTFERILLAQRMQASTAIAARLVKDQFDLLPPDPDRFNILFQTALKGSSLDTDDALGTAQGAEEAERVKTLSRSEAGIRPSGGPAAGGAAAATRRQRRRDGRAASCSPEALAEKMPQVAAGEQRPAQ